MGGAASKSPPVTPQSPKGTNQFITPKHEVVNTTPKSKDLFKEVRSEVGSIQKSISQSNINLHNELQKSASKSKFLDNVKERKEIERQKKAGDKTCCLKLVGDCFLILTNFVLDFFWLTVRTPLLTAPFLLTALV